MGKLEGLSVFLNGKGTLTKGVLLLGPFLFVFHSKGAWSPSQFSSLGKEHLHRILRLSNFLSLVIEFFNESLML